MINLQLHCEKSRLRILIDPVKQLKRPLRGGWKCFYSPSDKTWTFESVQMSGQQDGFARRSAKKRSPCCEFEAMSRWQVKPLPVSQKRQAGNKNRGGKKSQSTLKFGLSLLLNQKLLPRKKN